MPKVACPPDKVYDKSKKKCVDIGGENYKNTLSKNPDAFKVYDKKITKFLSKGKTCKKGETCFKMGGKTYKMYTKKNPDGVVTVKHTPVAPKKTSVPIKTCKDGEIYYKPTKRCLKVGGQTYKMYMKKNPDGFVTAKQTPTPVAFKKTPVASKKTPVAPKKTCKDGEAYYAPTKRCLKVGGQTYKTYMKKNPSGFDIKPRIVNKLLLTPVIEKKVISEKTKKLFMFKVSKFLRTIKNTKQANAIRNTSGSNAFGLPKHILTTQTRRVSIPFTLYLGARRDINASSFNKRIKKKRRIDTLTIHTDNFHDKVYRYALKSFTNPNIVDLKWFKEMTEYYKKLDSSELYTIWAYTYHGDVYLNLWERKLKIDYGRIDMSVFLYEIIGALSMPDYPRDIFVTPQMEAFDTTYTKFTKMTPNAIYQFWITLTQTTSRKFKPSFIKALLERMSMRLSNIIRKAPATKETMVVYRGVKDSFFTADDFTKRPKINEVFINKGFISTSLDPKVARGFSEGVCCFKVITILPGTKCLPLYGLSQFNEHEILFNKNTKYVIRDKYLAHVPTADKHGYFNNVISQEMKMTDIVIG